MEAVRAGGLMAENREKKAQDIPGGKKDNPFSVYAVVSQIGFMVIVPLLVFIWGASSVADGCIYRPWDNHHDFFGGQLSGEADAKVRQKRRT